MSDQRHGSRKNTKLILAFLIFSDRVKAEIGETIGELKRLGISLKVITGGNQRVTAYVGRQVFAP
jgi:magnesium-transporting ATPase (P-type)